MVHVALMVCGLVCGVGASGGGAGALEAQLSSSSATGAGSVGSVGLAHLLSHSWGKATLFMAVGVVLHGALTQDLRELG